MASAVSATIERRRYNRWVANETMEDFALRYTARRARRWSPGRVANTAIGSISFLALEAIGGAITLNYGFDIAVLAIMIVGAILFLTGLPIGYYAARYGVDIDLLTRGAGFGYIGSTITSLIYASFTFIFFALEAAILSLALEFSFGIPLSLGYLFSAMVVIPLVSHGFSKISAFQAWTQPFWVVLHILPFALLGFAGYDFENWSGFEGIGERAHDGQLLLMFGAASGVVFSLIAQIGEQVDFLRFLPEPRTPQERRRWWYALFLAGPGWSVLGVLKMLAGSYLVTLALREGVAPWHAGDPTWMYFTAFDNVIAVPNLALFLTGTFVILSQLKINVTNAYAGSIAWSNFFSRLTHSHPGRVVWLVFNVAIALMLMELGVFRGIEMVLGAYSHVALAWIGALVADLVINKPLGLSPKGIEFRRAYLFDFNPVGIGAMALSVILGLVAYLGLAGQTAQALSSFIALFTAFGTAPLIAWGTKGAYYIARPEPAETKGQQTCCVCEYTFDAEDMAHCPFYAGPICSLCCTLDSACRDTCKPQARASAQITRLLRWCFRPRLAELLMSRFSVFAVGTTALAGIYGGQLLVIRAYAGTPLFGVVLATFFCAALLVIGILVWLFILANESQDKARDETALQTERLMREIRAHERTDSALQDAKEKAEAANLAKTRYMTGISHELRTPLNAIYGFAQILENAPGIPPQHRESVSTIRRSSEHLAGLIEGLLDISKIEAGRLELFRNQINLPVFLKQVAGIFSEAAKERNIAFRLETRGAVPDWVAFDEKRLRQIVINLLSNAIRYTERGEVSLTLSYRNEVAVIEVSDTGIGIPESELERVWKPFERGGAATAPGSGLGLTITKLLVEILGGDISVESTLGKGSTFRVRLMLPSIDTAAAAAQVSEAVADGPGITGYLGPRKTILVVDDDLNHHALVESFLRPLGFAILVASGADQALEIVQDLPPDLFVLDIDMPGMDGWDLAAALRAGGHTATPIIMISGHALEARIPSEDAALHDGFIVKPYNLGDLLLRIGDLLRLEWTRSEVLPSETAPQAEISPAHVTHLLSLSEIGHAGGIRRKLDELESAGEIGGFLLQDLRVKLTAFDMPGITRTLREFCHDRV